MQQGKGHLLAKLEASGLGSTHFELAGLLGHGQWVDAADKNSIEDTRARNAILVANVAADFDEAARCAAPHPQAVEEATVPILHSSTLVHALNARAAAGHQAAPPVLRAIHQRGVPVRHGNPKLSVENGLANSNQEDHKPEFEGIFQGKPTRSSREGEAKAKAP